MKQTTFDRTTVTPSTAVIERIADASNCDPLELEPLHESIDPDALDRLIRGNGTEPHDHIRSVSFLYGKYEVTVRSSGSIELVQNS